MSNEEEYMMMIAAQPVREYGPIITETENALRPLEHVGSWGLCLYYAHHAAVVLHRHRLHPVIQAGSLQWPRTRPEEDDGIINTHFSYMWDPESKTSHLAWSIGHLPEMHVWLGVVETQEIVDFSTRHLKLAAQKAGLEWTAPDPPHYLWADSYTMPERVIYSPNRTATILAARILWDTFLPDYLCNPITRSHARNERPGRY